MNARRAAVIAILAVLLAACAASDRSEESESAAPSASAAESTGSAWPAAVSNPGVTWDARTGMTVIFGGNASGGNQLWGWDGARWTLLDAGTGTAPSARDDAQLVSDPERGVIWLHGGRSEAGGAVRLHTDTWRWDGRGWSQVVTDGDASAPPPRLHPVSAWDPASAAFVLAGGLQADDTFRRDTWAWDGERWRQLSAELSDGPAVACCRMALDPTSDALTILATDLTAEPTDGRYPSELWRQRADGGWEVVSEPGPSFSPIQPMVASESGLLLLLPGEQDASVTWAWDGTRWADRGVPGPPPRNGHALAYDAARRRVVLFSGFLGSVYRADLWEWDGSAWTEVERPDA